ncbi:hypothetical protein B0H13DRAFT_2507207 [Mycena leptocephala]|nr:hypothetical protein B0H13DRAFT_2507207 [Mycena leptocephala]
MRQPSEASSAMATRRCTRRTSSDCAPPPSQTNRHHLQRPRHSTESNPQSIARHNPAPSLDTTPQGREPVPLRHDRKVERCSRTPGRPTHPLQLLHACQLIRHPLSERAACTHPLKRDTPRRADRDSPPLMHRWRRTAHSRSSTPPTRGRFQLRSARRIRVCRAPHPLHTTLHQRLRSRHSQTQTTRAHLQSTMHHPGIILLPNLDTTSQGQEPSRCTVVQRCTELQAGRPIPSIPSIRVGFFIIPPSASLRP